MGAPLQSPSAERDYEALGNTAYDLAKVLYPICRSITGQGVRDTLDILERHVQLRRTNVPSGTKVFDWQVPLEWNIRDAYIKDSSGKRVVDFRDSNLQVVNYSTPVQTRMSLQELKPRLHAIPDQPDWIPYRTSYYSENWGFCLTQRQLDSLAEDDYEVVIDSTLQSGNLTLAECVVPGEVNDEVVIYTHTCHPSLCNDNLSAIAVSTLLAKFWSTKQHHFTYRFVFGPTTIGSIAWLSCNEQNTTRVRHGLVLASLGDQGQLVYKRSRRGNADIDRIAEYVATQHAGRIEDFSPYGYDERQFCSPGFNLPIGRLSRTPNGTYPEYHTSADNLDFISAAALGEALQACEEILHIVDNNVRYVNLAPKCEPRLGPRGLFRATGGRGPSEFEHALLWVLNQSDGENDLLSISNKSKLDFFLVLQAAHSLEEVGLVRPLR
jgi:aminopeptidase-like protein